MRFVFPRTVHIILHWVYYTIRCVMYAWAIVAAYIRFDSLGRRFRLIVRDLLVHYIFSHFHPVTAARHVCTEFIFPHISVFFLSFSHSLCVSVCFCLPQWYIGRINSKCVISMRHRCQFQMIAFSDLGPHRVDRVISLLYSLLSVSLRSWLLYEYMISRTPCLYLSTDNIDDTRGSGQFDYIFKSYNQYYCWFFL